MNIAKLTWIIVLAALAAPVKADQYTKTFQVSGEPRLTLSNVSGDITIEAGDNQEIVIQVTRDDEAIEVNMEQTNGRVEVKTHFPKRQRTFDGGVHFHVFFPSQGRLDVESVSGNVEVMGIAGDLELSSVSGHVVLNRSSGDLELSSVSGDVEAYDIGPADMDASSISGNVIYEGNFEDGDYEFSSTSGNVKIRHGASAAYHIRGQTVSGSIRNNVGDEIRIKKDKWGPMKSMEGSVNGNGVSVEVDTVSGSISIERL